MAALSSDPFGGSGTTIWTVGHSTRTFDEYVALLEENRIQVLADVRHFPTSKRAPWATKTTLAPTLRERGTEYEPFEILGGYRKARPNSVNTGWRNAGFRGYADHMMSAEFTEALDRLIRLAANQRTAIMCAEAVPWKCHRSLLSDALLARGVHVVHILSPGSVRDHRLTSFARIHGGRVTYPASKKGV